MAARTVFACDDLDVIDVDFQEVIDANEQSDQLAGFAHKYEVWADDVTTGTNLFIGEVVSNVVSLYSSAALTKNLGTTANRWSTVYGVNADLSGTLTLSPITATHVLYAGVGGLVSGSAGFTWTNATSKLTLGTNAIFSQGAHGLTLAADDHAFGSTSTSNAWWDDSITRLTLTGASGNALLVVGAAFGTGRFEVSGPNTQAFMNFYNTSNSNRSVMSLTQTSNNARLLLFNDSGSAVIDIQANTSNNSTFGTRLIFNQWTNTGTTTLATAQGDIAAGKTGVFQTWYDQSTGTQFWYGSGGAVWGQIIAGTGMSLGTTAAPTTGFELDVVGDCRVSLGLNVGGTAVPGTGEVKALWYNGGTATDAAASGQWATGLTGAGRLYFDPALVNGAGFDTALTMYDRVGAIAVQFIAAGNGSTYPPAGWVFNESASVNNDLRVEGGSLAYMLFLDASTATENWAILAASAPAWNSMDRGIFIGDSTTAPTGNPTAGGYLYVVAGALTWRGSGGTITTVGPA